MVVITLFEIHCSTLSSFITMLVDAYRNLLCFPLLCWMYIFQCYMMVISSSKWDAYCNVLWWSFLGWMYIAVCYGFHNFVGCIMQ